MSHGVISINSNEVNEVIKKIGDSVIDLQNNAYKHIEDDYKDLSDLDLLGEGLETTKKGIDAVIDEETKIIKLLKDHLDTYYSTEEEIVSYINSFDYSKDKAIRVASQSSYDKTDMDDVTDGRKITNTNIMDFITGIDTPIERILLKNINKNVELFTTDINELLINPEKSGLLVEILKKICGDTNTDIDTTNTIDTINIQKTLLKKLTDNEPNIYSGIVGKSLLVALPYVSKKSENENVTFEDMIYKDENKDKLFGTLNDLYQGKPLDGYNLQEDEVNCFREYINDIADTNNITVEDLFGDISNLDLIKKGA
jgi:hypothetical protein